MVPELLYTLQYKSISNVWVIDSTFQNVRIARRIQRERNLNRLPGAKYRITVYKLHKRRLTRERNINHIRR